MLAVIVNRVLVAREVVRAGEDDVAGLARGGVDAGAAVGAGLGIAGEDGGGGHAHCVCGAGGTGGFGGAGGGVAAGGVGVGVAGRVGGGCGGRTVAGWLLVRAVVFAFMPLEADVGFEALRTAVVSAGVGSSVRASVRGASDGVGVVDVLL